MSYQASEGRYGAMQYARSGRSGLLLPRVSLGLWHNFGSCDHFDTMRAMLRTAFDCVLRILIWRTTMALNSAAPKKISGVCSQRILHLIAMN